MYEDLHVQKAQGGTVPTACYNQAYLAGVSSSLSELRKAWRPFFLEAGPPEDLVLATSLGVEAAGGAGPPSRLSMQGTNIINFCTSVVRS
jgi:hypothetical protein